MVRNQWVESCAVYEDIYNAAELYGLYDDLYDHGYFKPCMMLDIKYKNGDMLVPVHRGNTVKLGEAASAPVVKYESADSVLWILA